MTNGFGILERFEKVINIIDYKNNTDIQNIYKIYPQIAEVLARIVNLLRKRGLSISGHCKNLDEDECNMANFLAISYPILKEPIEKSLRKDFTYLSYRKESKNSK